jgi:Na+/proline symporter/signal transduction histidine kinase
LIENWLIITVALGYLLLLFAIAEFGERFLKAERARPWIFSLSLAIYCTSWAMYGTVGQAESTGWFLAPTYFGSILLFIFAWPVILRIVRIAKQNQVTSIADFIAGRFGGSHLIGGLVVCICLVAVIPYIALQLQSIVSSYLLISSEQVIPNLVVPDNQAQTLLWQDTALYITLIVAVFTILFGTRKIDATEHHSGIMLAVAFESIVKLTAFIAVGLFAVYSLNDGFADLLDKAIENPLTNSILNSRQPSFIYLTQAFLGVVAILCLPRQFHVLVVENRNEQELSKSRWIFPGYLLLINFFILPVAIVGKLYFADSPVSAEHYSLLLPGLNDNHFIAGLVFIGGISAATSMIIVAVIVLSTMISNEIIVPFAVKFFSVKLADKNDLGQRLLWIRRLLILTILVLAYLYYRNIAISEQLSTTGLLSMALIAQLAPALIASAYWKRCSQTATIIALACGAIIWSYTLLIPSLASANVISNDLIANGPFGIELLKPTQLFGLYGFDALTHGLFWSLQANLFCLVYFSLKHNPSIKQRLQTGQFFSTDPDNRQGLSAKDSDLSVDDLLLLAERFMGRTPAAKAFDRFCQKYSITDIKDANVHLLMGYVEQLLQAIIGSTSTRLVFESLANNKQVSFEDVANMIDEAADVLLFNRELLQSAIENVSHGISVVDKELKLVAWNTRYKNLFDYPDSLLQVGRPIDDLIRFNAEKGQLSENNIEDAVSKRLEYMRQGSPHVYERSRDDGLVLEMRGNPMPGGGFVTSFIDITEFRMQQNELKKINVELEQRVSHRTEELEKLNLRLLEAKSMAELANHSKTRFLAAASHDVLQPLNAASLFSATLFEKVSEQSNKELALRIQQALHSAEQLLKDLIEISKLDSGHIEPSLTTFSVEELMRQLSQEIKVLAEKKGITLKTVFSHQFTRTDRTMLRRVLQNLLSNAVKHSQSKKILFGCRRHKNTLSIHVTDQGRGIDASQQDEIFKEFVQLYSDKQVVEGHGLGLAIVSRILNILKLPLAINSRPGHGSDFYITVPLVENVDHCIIAESEPAISFVNTQSAISDRLILCIDNDQQILDGMQALLDNWGYKNLLLSLDGDFSKTANYRPEKVALILADYHLEDCKTGVEVIDNIRNTAQWDIPSVVITADQSDAIKREIQENRIFLLHKPIKPLSLRTLLNRLMKP